ncbi:mediator of RNA polymerase II transcription subunit 1 isoform X2 [Ricinus communis]|uniref:Uncharacterized protein n=1 Tax=Ricinus communis TaxID=3988 RepID=B9RJB5_RICCO|nr:mediator of RNA polymerase II transcription subunit 1 isoform X2 [Ricinus communis]EEF48417.1 conserved hypothetical protein [Ricinus communis]|eukprot:XP_002513834.1 mediator of RNA polymerase II transcription subunit 1 isoform X2 [Ricinus communis]
MERSEPTLVPEWLRSSGSVPGGGSSAHHFASSSPHSDVSSSVHHSRSRNSKSTSDFDSPRSAFLDRTSSSNSRRSSSNGSAKHAYSSFSRSHRDKDRERDKERLNFGNHWDNDASDPLGSILSRNEKDALRRSHSMVSRKLGEVLPRRFAADLRNGSNSNHVNGNGLISGGGVGNSIPKAVFEKDFPSLGSEERQGAPDIGRVSSPGLSTAVQSLPVSSSALIGGEGWTSALAEVPAIIGNNSSGSSSSVQTVATSASGAPSTVAGLNMAEALTQAPTRTRTAPQLSVQTQRLEELAIKQSRQLIPVTPSMPKSSVLNSSDKSKPKTVVRSSEMNMAPKNLQQQPSSLHAVTQSLAGGHVKSDASKASHGKLFVLKPGWENGASPSPKDIANPNNAGRAANSQLAAAPSVPSAPLRSPNNPKLSAGERKSASLNLISGFNVEKRPLLSQTQSRHDFFNLLKKKTLKNSSTALTDSASAISSPTNEKACEINKEAASAPSCPQAIKNGSELTGNGGTCEEVSEEEAAFLRSLGWEENSGEDEGLTEEEINAFIQECMKLKPSLKVCRGMQQKLIESHATGLVRASSDRSSSDSGSEM